MKGFEALIQTIESRPRAGENFLDGKTKIVTITFIAEWPNEVIEKFGNSAFPTESTKRIFKLVSKRAKKKKRKKENKNATNN